jgi:hypothetical protein
MAVLGINYDGGGSIYDDTGKHVGYESLVEYKYVYLHTRKEKFIFDSGDFILDWYSANKKYFKEIYSKEPKLSHSSSVNHFIFDGAPYSSAYFHVVNKKNVIKYIDKTDKDWIFTQKKVLDGIEFFVHENTQPTFDEFADYIAKTRLKYEKNRN